MASHTRRRTGVRRFARRGIAGIERRARRTTHPLTAARPRPAHVYVAAGAAEAIEWR